jgi:hypothetical protein
MLCVGVSDEFGAWNYWLQENIDYERSGIDYLSIAMSDQGHTYPYGIDPEYHYDRFMAFMDFLMYYLKGDQAPRLLYTSAVDGTLMGDVKITRYDKEGTKDFLRATVDKGTEIFAQFLAPVTEESARSGIHLYDVTAGREVPCQLQAMGNGNKWYLFPEGDLTVGNTYEIRVSGDIKSVLNGKAVGEDSSYRFVFEGKK